MELNQLFVDQLLVEMSLATVVASEAVAVFERTMLAVAVTELRRRCGALSAWAVSASARRPEVTTMDTSIAKGNWVRSARAKDCVGKSPEMVTWKTAVTTSM
jgi:hypothetical protein